MTHVVPCDVFCVIPTLVGLIGACCVQFGASGMAYTLMKFAFKAGCNFFDTAEAYAGGEAETLMGDAIAKG